MHVCDRKCFACQFDDCICDDMDYQDYQMSDALEKEIIHPKTAQQRKVAARQKAYREANKDKIAARQKAYYEANKDKVAAYKKAYREANKDKIAAYKKAYREARKKRKGPAGAGKQ